MSLASLARRGYTKQLQLAFSRPGRSLLSIGSSDQDHDPLPGWLVSMQVSRISQCTYRTVPTQKVLCKWFSLCIDATLPGCGLEGWFWY